MKMSEKFKIEKKGEGATPHLGSECPWDIQVFEPRSVWVAHRRLVTNDETLRKDSA